MIFCAYPSLIEPACLGATDEFGFQAIENKVQLHDIHATILDLMGLDHERLSYFHQGVRKVLPTSAGE